MKRTQTGRLRHPVTIESPIEVPTEAGEWEVAIWGVYANRRAEITPLKGSETFRAQHLDPEVTHSIKVRYVEGVTPKMRIVWGARTFNILSAIDPEEMRRELEIMAVERIGN